MRSYPRNSPEAAARILALVMISDGHVCRSELAALQSLDLAGALGLSPDALPQVVQALCEDLLLATGGLAEGVDAALLAALMAEIDDPALQRTLLGLCLTAAAADAHLSDGEAVMLDAVRRHWPDAVPVAVAA